MKKLIGIILLVLICIGIFMFFKKTEKEHTDNLTISENLDSNVIIDGKQISKEEIVVLSDKLFLINLDEIYANYKKYEGKYLQIDGFVFNDPGSGNIIVGREYSCCGPDNFLIGLECEDSNVEYKNDTWIRATGIIKVVEDKENKLNPIIISLTNVTSHEIPEGDKLVSY